MENIGGIEKDYEDFDFLNLSPEKLRELTLHILKTPSQLRSQKDQQIIENDVTQTDLFKSILQEDDSVPLTELCANLTYCYLPPDQILFKQGSEGTACYIILEGALEVLIDRPDSDGAIKVAEISAGTIFGELALLAKVKSIRKATVKATKNPCHLASLGRDAYRKILRQLEDERELDKQIWYLDNVPFFKSLNLTSKKFLERFESMCYKRVYSMGSVIYKEGEPCEDVYFVKSGELRSTKLVQIRSTESNVHIDESYPSDSDLTTKKLELATIVPGQFFGDEEALMLHLIRLKESTKNHHYMRTKNPLNEREKFLFKLNNLISQSLVNEDLSSSQEKEIIYRSNSFSNPEVLRDCTVKVSAKAEVWKISVRYFFQLFDMNIEAYQYLLSKLEQSRERREERLPSIANHTRLITAKGGSRRQKLLQLQNEVEKSLDAISSESSPVKHSSSKNEESSSKQT